MFNNSGKGDIIQLIFHSTPGWMIQCPYLSYCWFPLIFWRTVKYFIYHLLIRSQKKYPFFPVASCFHYLHILDIYTTNCQLPKFPQNKIKFDDFKYCHKNKIINNNFVRYWCDVDKFVINKTRCIKSCVLVHLLVVG
jgi:hypothetical protein